MKNSTLLIVGVGVPSELTEVLAKAGCEVQRSDSPLAAAIALVRGDVDLVLMVGPQDESWNDFTDAAFATGKLVSVESLIAIPGRAGQWRGRQWQWQWEWQRQWSFERPSNGEEHVDVGMTISEVVELVQRRASTQHVVQDYIYTKVGNKLRKVSLDDILFIEVEGKYSALQVRDRKYNVKASLKDLLHKLPSDRFVRVSRNFVVNLNQIQHIDTFQYTVKVGDLEIPISRTYKEELMRHINLI